MTTNNRYLAEEHLGRINRVMDHIERNMDRSFTLEELADIANFSKFHFSRIFWAMTGETPFEFLMRIRMEKAASLLLMNPKESISEISYLCGYSSLPVFSRNYKSHFSLSASEWRKRFLDDAEGLANFHSNNSQTNRNSGQIHRNSNQAGMSSTNYFSQQYEPLKWRTNMELNKGVEIKEFPKTTIAYVRHTGPYKGNEELFEKLYGELFAWAGPRNLANQPDLKTFNVYHDDPDGGKYVVARFELVPMDYEKAWGWLFGEWFPSSGFQPADGPCFEMCGDKVDDDLHKVEICVPVKPL